ncbi:hypothetical protein IH86_22910 [Sphingobium yanoikuyae]|nr:hypothetical protein IH86_22910 [Sphingobium yanoikuyae]KZC80481.1 hypothetical protein AYR46_11250 [Sphingobium yanoikuyae]
MAFRQSLRDQQMGERHGNTQSVGDFAQLESAQSIHLDGDALPFGQTGKSLLDTVQFRLRGDNCFGRRRIVGHLCQMCITALRQMARLPARASLDVDSQITDDPVQIGHRIPQHTTPQRLPQMQPGVLNDILRLGAAAHYTLSIVDQRASMRGVDIKADHVGTQDLPFVSPSALSQRHAQEAGPIIAINSQFIEASKLSCNQCQRLKSECEGKRA